MPAYQPPEAPLTVESHRQIHKLCESRNNRLKEHLKSAFEKLTDTACDINERSTDARVRYEKIRRQRREAVANADGNGDGDVSEEEDQNSEEFQQLAEQERKVADVTARLEEKMRQLIDTEARYEILQNSISRIETEEDEVQNAALGARQTRESRRRRRRASHSEDDGEDERDENHEATPEQEMRQRNAQNPPSRRLDDYLTEGTGKWNGLSLTERWVKSLPFQTKKLMLMDMQVRRPQHLHRILSRCTQLQIPRRRCPANATLFEVVFTSGRYKCAHKYVYSWQSRPTKCHTCSA